ncbi:MAG: septal ring lytic transglycosylase RlpA family protein [Geminicoccaceae bacterium]
MALLGLLAACGTTGSRPSGSGGQASVGHYKVGSPYKVNGRWYRPEYDPAYVRVGTASWYGADFHGLPTANGEVFDKEQLTAAHPTLPLPSIVRVTNLDNGRRLDVRVNDRGPFVGDRLIDLSQAAARKLGYESSGLASVRVEFVGLADADGPPPAPIVATAARVPAPASAPMPVQVAAPKLEVPAGHDVQVAALAGPPFPRACAAGPLLVQIGAFGETDQVRIAMATVDGLAPVQVEPAFAGSHAVARVRLGPVADPAAADRLLAKAVALGYTDAFLVPATGRGGVMLASC